MPLVPGGKVGQGYSYDQRNLLRTGYMIGSVNTLDVDFIYDGNGNRLQQIDHSGATPITTTYTNDNTGLSQALLSDDGATTTANLFGLDLIHQHDGAGTRTLLADGLGSVRMEMVGEAIETVTTYEPYGKLLAQTGSSGTSYGYTGEQHDGAAGLVYLRARYYDPYLNQFQSRDPFPGYANRPASFHGYLYVYANPATLADPTGMDPYWCEGKPEPDKTLCYQAALGIDPRELTPWLYEEMVTNLNDPRLQNVRQANRAGDIGLTIGTGLFAAGCMTVNPLIALTGGIIDVAGMGAYGAAAYQFNNLVADRQPWDFKHKILDFLGPGISLCATAGCQNDIEYSVPGNIHFGFVAREAGYLGVITHMGAAFAEITDPAHDPNSPHFIDPYDSTDKFGVVVGPAGVSLNVGDDPKDHQAIQFGIYLYNKYGRALTYVQFKQELGSFMTSFATHPPDTQPVRPDRAANWPYWVGYFKPDPQ